VIGIQGKVRNTKNKCSVPFRECEFELFWDEGLNPYAGLLKQLEVEALVTRNGAWYTVNGTGKKFQSKEFQELLVDQQEVGFDPLRKFFGL
jgi:recombination protein RecA